MTTNKPTTAPEFLAQAGAIMAQRAKDYDQPGGERSMDKTIAAFNIITGRDLSEADGWLIMEILKNVRQWSAPGFHRDSAEDGVSYSALKAEALARGEVAQDVTVCHRGKCDWQEWVYPDGPKDYKCATCCAVSTLKQP